MGEDFHVFTPSLGLVDGSIVESRFGFTSQSVPQREKLVGCSLARGRRVTAKNCCL